MSFYNRSIRQWEPHIPKVHLEKGNGKPHCGAITISRRKHLFAKTLDEITCKNCKKKAMKLKISSNHFTKKEDELFTI